MSTTPLIFKKINAAGCHVITLPETDRQRKTRDSRCFILVVIFGLRTGSIEGMDGWASAGINLLLILTANTFASVYPTLGLSGKIISERKQMKCESKREDIASHPTQQGNEK